MSLFAQTLADTVRNGGTLVFLKDQAPEDLNERLRLLRADPELGIPVAVLSLNEIQSGTRRTGFRDLTILFEAQKALLSQINSQLQGQRLLLTSSVVSSEQEFALDFVSGEVTLEEWIQLVHQLRQLLAQPPAKMFERAYEAPVLFLDRDDVIVKNIPYNREADRVELLPGVADLINRAHSKNYWVALVTNQSGLGRGLIQWEEYRRVHQKMLQLLAAQGAWLDECVWSSFIEDSPTDEGRFYASLRKPRGGMFQWVLEKLKAHPEKSIMVGDSASDLVAAHSVGVGTLYLMKSDKQEEEIQKLRLFPEIQYEILDNPESCRL